MLPVAYQQKAKTRFKKIAEKLEVLVKAGIGGLTVAQGTKRDGKNRF